ncbi:MAG: hypothetical protein ABI634_01025 [Acidobacteriota bacterium]
MSQTTSHEDGTPALAAADRLDSWKEIAGYLGRGVTTVQRWEQDERLPIHRLPHAKKGSVFAYRQELDQWIRHRSREGVAKAVTSGEPGTASDLATQAPVHEAQAAKRHWTRLRLGTVASAIVLLLALAAWSAGLNRDAVATPRERLETRPQAPTPLRPVPVANTGDDERAPSLSPDGRQLAYAWLRTSQPGIYVKTLPDGVPKLFWPMGSPRERVYITKWSQDGGRIAFNREEGEDTYGLFAGPVDGPAARLTSMAGVGICWTPDGRALTFADRTSTSEPFSLYSIDLTTRERSRVTTPPAGSFGDTACAWRDDGARLAFTRFSTRFDADVFVVEPETGGPPLKLASGRGGIDDLAWTPDGDELIFTNQPGLRLVRADSTEAPVDVPGIRGQIGHPTFSKPTPLNAASLAFQTEGSNWNAWVWRADQPLQHEPWNGSGVAGEEFPALTSDGQRLAYVRGGQVWTANVDGSQTRQLTFHGAGSDRRIVTDPRWSPDGRRIAFSVPIGEQRDIYVIDADGSNSFRLTSEPSLEDHPAWSADGRWIYFRSDRGGLNHIWRAPASGGAPTKITSGEGWQALEALDGRSIYFVRGTSDSGLWRASVQSGEEQLVISGVRDSRWAVTSDGILFVDTQGRDSRTIRLLPTIGGRTRVVTTLPDDVGGGFTATADGRTVLWTRLTYRAPDVMIVSPWKR